MSVFKRQNVHKTILDFGNTKLTKNSIQKSIRKANFSPSYYGGDGVSLTFIDNEIHVGIYKIKLLLDCTKEGNKLRNYGRFGIILNEGSQEINTSKDVRFKSQYWIKSSINNQLNISHLIDIILYCKRMDKLKCFL